METKASFRLAVSSAVSVATNEETFIMADKTNQLLVCGFWTGNDVEYVVHYQRIEN